MKKILYILLALCMVGCGKKAQNARSTTAIRVKTMVVASDAQQGLSRYVGAIEPQKETKLSMQATGRVTSIEVKNGQRVTKGQTLVTIDNTQALNRLEGAEATLKHAQDGYDRAKKVHEQGVVSDQKMVEIESKLAQAQAIYATAKQQLDECTLIAPCNGVVNGLDLQFGQTILPGAPICSIIDLSAFCVKFTVPEAEITHLTRTPAQLTGTVEVAAVDQTYPITITDAAMVANALTHTYEVKANIKGGAELLKPGMVGVVRINHKPSEGTAQNIPIVIPAECILMKPEGATVWIAEENKAVRRNITIGGYQADGVRVREGLQAGDQLITEGYQKLYHNCDIEIISEDE